MTRIHTSMKTCERYMLLGDVTRRLRCKPHQIVYLLTTGQVPEPARLGNRRVFTAGEVDRIAKRLSTKKENR